MVIFSGWYFNPMTDSRVFAHNRECRLQVEEQQCHPFWALLSNVCKESMSFCWGTFLTPPYKQCSSSEIFRIIKREANDCFLSSGCVVLSSVPRTSRWASTLCSRRHSETISCQWSQKVLEGAVYFSWDFKNSLGLSQFSHLKYEE